jgi:hypothetical protein
MNEQKQQSALDETDNEMIQVLRACGFHVRTSGLLDKQRPQVFGSLDSAIALFKLIVAGADVAPDETAQAADRNAGRLRLAEAALLKNGFTKLDDIWVAPKQKQGAA